MAFYSFSFLEEQKLRKRSLLNDAIAAAKAASYNYYMVKHAVIEVKDPANKKEASELMEKIETAANNASLSAKFAEDVSIEVESAKRHAKDAREFADDANNLFVEEYTINKQVLFKYQTYKT